MLTLSFASLSASLESIERSEFGKHLSQTIQLQMSLKGGVDDVIALIVKLRDSIGEEQSQANGAHDTFQGECETTITEHNNELDAQNTKLGEANGVISDLGPKLDQANSDKSTATDNLSAAEGQKSTATKDRQVYRDAHTTAIGEYDAAIEACNQAIALVTENLLDSNAAFLQRSPVMI